MGNTDGLALFESVVEFRQVPGGRLLQEIRIPKEEQLSRDPVLSDDGRLLVTSWADSSLFVLDNGKKTTVASGIASPADIGLNGKRVAVPQLMENKVQFWELP